VGAPSQELVAIAYHVYEVSPGSANEARLTATPLVGTQYLDTRMTWGATRCYVVRAVLNREALAVEGDGTAPACVTLADTFPPAAPTGLQAVAGEATISLIWDANGEMDLDGYIVLRAARPGAVLMPITAGPIHETTFRDTVQAGVVYLYAVAAVDKTGNVSAPSTHVEETAR